MLNLVDGESGIPFPSKTLSRLVPLHLARSDLAKKRNKNRRRTQKKENKTYLVLTTSYAPNAKQMKKKKE